jgi:hypothetical protein
MPTSSTIAANQGRMRWVAGSSICCSARGEPP